MEIKINSKAMKAFNGLMLAAIAIILMACSYSKLVDVRWLIGLFMMLGACALGFGWYADEKKDGKLAVRACFYFLFAIVFFTKKYIVFEGYFFALWAMLEGVLLFADGLKAKEEGNNSWALIAGIGALALILGFVATFVVKSAGQIVEEAFMTELQNAFSYRGGAEEIPEPKMSIVVGLSFLAVAVGNILPVLGQITPKIEVKQ